VEKGAPLKTRFYAVSVPNGAEWARIWITDDGCFFTISDYGNYGFWWHAASGDFRKFLCGVDADYLTGKLADGAREFDGEASVKAIRRQIVEGRRSGSFTRGEAAYEWDLVHPKPDRRLAGCGRYSHMDSDVAAHEWYLETDFRDVSELLCYRKPIQLQMFVEKLWPLFVEKLKDELHEENRTGWIAVDLDGTLAEYKNGDWKRRGPFHVGRPIPKMLARVKAALAAGTEVRIFTARVSGVEITRLAEADPLAAQYRDVATIRAVIEAWCLEHVGCVLPITNAKNTDMLELWDDRAIQVESNTGRRMDGKE